jgi:hypothetical protein
VCARDAPLECCAACRASGSARLRLQEARLHAQCDSRCSPVCPLAASRIRGPRLQMPTSPPWVPPAARGLPGPPVPSPARWKHSAVLMVIHALRLPHARCAIRAPVATAQWARTACTRTCSHSAAGPSSPTALPRMPENSRRSYGLKGTMEQRRNATRTSAACAPSLRRRAAAWLREKSENTVSAGRCCT